MKEFKKITFKEEEVSIPQSNPKQLLMLLTEELIKSINNLSEKLPNDSSYFLRNKINSSLNDASESINMAFGDDKRQNNKMRSMIKADTALDECTVYLDLAQTLRYARTEDIVDKIKNMKKLINNKNIPTKVSSTRIMA